MSSESLTKYLEYFRRFVIPQWRINDNVHSKHHKYAIEKCTILHDQIVELVDLINFYLSQSESKTELRATSEELGKTSWNYVISFHFFWTTSYAI